MNSKLCNSLLIGEAIYSLVKGSLGATITNRSELLQLLHVAGCNPSADLVLRLPNQEIEFLQFYDILRNMPSINEDFLRGAFQLLDLNGTGLVNLSDLEDLLGRNHLRLSDVDKRILNINDSGELDYNMFLSDFKRAIVQLQALALHRVSQPLAPHSKQSPREAPESSSRKPTEVHEAEQTTDQVMNPLGQSDEFSFVIQRRGFFLLECKSDQTVVTVAQRFHFEIIEEQTICIEIEHLLGAFDTRMVTPIDVWLILYDSNGRVVANSSRKDVKHKSKSTCSARLKAGAYTLIPFTTQCLVKPRADELSSVEKAEIIRMDKDGKYGLTKEMRLILLNIFDLCDLDNSGSLSREEFNLYNLRTGDEEVTDSEWELLQEHFKTSNGELNLRDFLTLHQMEAEDCNGDTEDMWLSLESVGCNHKLQLDEIWPFTITIRSAKAVDNIKAQPMQPMSNVEWNSLACYFSEQPLIPVAEKANIRLFAFKTDGFLALILHNDQSEPSEVMMNLENSRNLLFNVDYQARLKCSGELQIAAFGIPKRSNEETCLDVQLLQPEATG
uniref:EF-hand domain-containing protein n=1 Tax=Trichuris muris TaxID=70415 RepID=A0A5S6Q7Z9_TRIMR